MEPNHTHMTKPKVRPLFVFCEQNFGRIRSPHPTTISGTTPGPLTRRPPVGRRSVVLPVPHGSAKTRLGSSERLVEGGTEGGDAPGGVGKGKGREKQTLQEGQSLGCR
jgi:hypothetical protein